MPTRYTKINASDYEDGVVIFKKVTDGEGKSTFQQLTAEEMQTELGAVDPNNYDANTFLFVEDDGSGTNNIVSPQSISEVKSLLGLPSKVYEAYVNTSGENNPTITTIKNTLMSDVAWTRGDVGYYTCAVTISGYPSGEFTSGKTICFTQGRGTGTPMIIGLTLGTHSINFQTYNLSGVETDSLDFYVKIEVYE